MNCLADVRDSLAHLDGVLALATRGGAPFYERGPR
jgi:hypothetical protein